MALTYTQACSRTDPKTGKQTDSRNIEYRVSSNYEATLISTASYAVSRVLIVNQFYQ